MGFIPSLSEYNESEDAKFGRHCFPPAMSADNGALVKETWSVDLANNVSMIWYDWNQNHTSERPRSW